MIMYLKYLSNMIYICCLIDYLMFFVYYYYNISCECSMTGQSLSPKTTRKNNRIAPSRKNCQPMPVPSAASKTKTACLSVPTRLARSGFATKR